MKRATVLMRVHAVIAFILIVILAVVFYKQSPPFDAFIVFILLLTSFLFALYFARESGKGEPMNFKEVLERHGNTAEWSVKAYSIDLPGKWTGLVRECKSGAIYFVYFAKEDVLDLDQVIKELDCYFGAYLFICPYGKPYKYSITPR